MGPTPVGILTGFLGAGKTTVLQKMLAQQDYGDTAVLINEFGEIGIDQQLIAPVSPDVVLLDSGCLCCQIRGELKDTLTDLLDRRANGRLPPFKRIVIETTGLAEPTPIIATVQADPMLRHQLRMAGTLTVVDAVNGEQMADSRNPIWLQQVSAADVILITKIDVAPESVERLAARLSALVPEVRILRQGLNDALPALAQILEVTGGAGRSGGELSSSVEVPASSSTLQPQDGVRSLALTTEQLIDWTAFGVWLSALLHVHGKAVLRIKGILDIGEANPVLINGVQHMIYAPQHLLDRPAGRQPSQLVVISTGLDAARIEASFRHWVLGER